MSLDSSKTLNGREVVPSAQVAQMLATGPRDAPEGYQRAPRAVLFTDIVGSTAYFEQRGDEAGMAMLERHNGLLFPVIGAWRGRLVKTIGDAIMAAFAEPADAVQAAVEMQTRLEAHNAGQPPEERLAVRIGVNYGPVILQDGDLFGDVVNAAARVEGLARGGQVLISGAVNEALGKDFPLPCLLFDAVRVRGKEVPLEVFEVRWNPDAPHAARAGRERLTAGTVLGGRFEIRALLGEGGMGQVYKATDHALQEEVALKFISGDLARRPQALERFKHEARLTRSLTHANVCRIHEFFEMEGHVFLSMELLRGRTLEDVLKAQAPLPVPLALHVAGGIAAGLREAHARGFVHRDLKPTNVMLEARTGRVVLMDFGIAQLASDLAGGGEGVLAGTPAYMSPEQVRGQAQTTASDIYGLGVLLYEMLTGCPPHTGPTPMAVAAKHLSETPAPLQAAAPTVPAPLARVVMRCLAKDPAARYADAGAAAAALAEAAEPPRGGAGRIVALSAGVSALLVLLVLALLDRPHPAPPPGEPAVVNPPPPRSARPLVTSSEVERYGRWSPDGRTVAFLRDGEVWRLDLGGDERALTRGARAAWGDGLTGLSWLGEALVFAAGEVDDVRLMRVPAAGGPPEPLLDGAAGVDVSPDGQWLAFVQPDARGFQGIAMARADGSERRVMLPADESRAYLEPRFSPDGRRLALVIHQIGFRSTRDVAVYDIAGGRLTPLTTDGLEERAYNTDPAWTPDGQHVVYASKRTGTLSLWQVPARGGRSVPLTQGAIQAQGSPDVAADGRILFDTRTEQFDIALVDLQRGAQRDVTQDIWPDRFPAFDPTGRRLAYRSQRTPEDVDDRMIAVRDLETGETRRVTGPAGLRDFTWCDASAVAYAATAEEGDRRVGVLDLDSGDARPIVSDFHRTWAAACSPEGRRIVFVGQRTEDAPRLLWLVETDGGEPRQIGPDDGVAGFPAWAPDGARLAWRWAPSLERLGEAELRLLDLRTGEAHTVPTDDSWTRGRRRLRFSRDGRAVYYMEAVGPDAHLWRQPVEGGPPEAVIALRDVHTFDFDLSPDERRVVYPKVVRQGDLFVLETP